MTFRKNNDVYNKSGELLLLFHVISYILYYIIANLGVEVSNGI